MSKLIFIAVFFLNLLCSLTTYAQTPISIHSDSDETLSLGAQLEYFEDIQGQLAFDEIKQLRSTYWTKSDAETPNFGYTNSAYWLRFRLVSSLAEIQAKIIALHYSLLDQIEFFQVEDGELVSYFLTGDTYPFTQRPLRHRDFLFPVTLEQAEPVDIYFRINTQGSTQVPIKLWDAEKFSWADQDEQFVKTLYYGMMLVMVVYNLFLFISIREKPYLYYVGLVLSVLVLMSGAHGYLYQYLYPLSPTMHQMSMLLAVPSIMFFASIFSSNFLHLNKVAPRLNALLNVFSVLFLCSIAGSFFLPYDISTRTSVFLAMPASLVIMYAGPYAWIKGQTSARYFTIAWFFLLTGIVVSAASKFGVLPRNGFTEHALNWGAALEVILLSFALADRYNRERFAKVKAQKKQIEESEQRKTAEAKLYYQATHHRGNGFPNIVMLQQFLHQLLHSESMGLRHFSLVFIHLSRIHDINKTLGHANADIVLGLFSKRLLDVSIDSDISLMIEEVDNKRHYFAQIEGVIFAYIINTGDKDKTLAHVSKVRHELAEPIEFNGMELDLGLDIGIAEYPNHGSDIDTLIRHARVAIDSADNSNEHIGIYSQDINPYSARRLMLMGELKKAIVENTLALHFQPIIMCASGGMVGAEALLRWSHPSMGFVPPDEFILLAEQTGIMRSLTYWVMDNALAAKAAWPHGSEQQMISVNISAVNLHEKDFESNVINLLEKHRVDPECLLLEITETAVMKDPETARVALQNLAGRGIKLGIDDFGTGHSSLSYIRQLPVYEIKIDRSFVMEMDLVAGDEIIVKTTLNMCRDLGYKVVAEGIENQVVLNKLKEMKCDFSQGYHIAKPMPLDALKVWMIERGHDQLLPEKLRKTDL